MDYGEMQPKGILRVLTCTQMLLGLLLSTANTRMSVSYCWWYLSSHIFRFRRYFVLLFFVCVTLRLLSDFALRKKKKSSTEFLWCESKDLEDMKWKHPLWIHSVRTGAFSHWRYCMVDCRLWLRVHFEAVRCFNISFQLNPEDSAATSWFTLTKNCCDYVGNAWESWVSDSHRKRNYELLYVGSSAAALLFLSPCVGPPGPRCSKYRQ